MIGEHFIDVLFLQETMCGGDILVSEMESMINGWKFFYLWMLKVNLGGYF